MLRFIGELRLNEGLVLIFLHVAVNITLIIAAGLHRIYSDQEGPDTASMENFKSIFSNSTRTSCFAMACGGTGLMILTISVRVWLWRSSAYGLKMRAKKVLIDLIVAANPYTMTEAMFMNYNFTLDQLQKIHSGDISDLKLAKQIQEMQVTLVLRLILMRIWANRVYCAGKRANN